MLFKKLRAKLAAKTPDINPEPKIRTAWNLLLLINTQAILNAIAHAIKTPLTYIHQGYGLVII